MVGRYELFTMRYGKGPWRSTEERANRLFDLHAEIMANISAGDPVLVKDHLRKTEITQEKLCDLLK